MRTLFYSPKLNLIILFIISLSSGYFALNLKQDNSPEVFFSADKQAEDDYRKMVKVFGTDEYLLIQVEGASLDRAKDIRFIQRLTKRLRELEEVKLVFSLSDDFNQEELVEKEEILALKEKLAHFPLYKRLGLYEKNRLGIIALIALKGADARHRFAQRMNRLKLTFSKKGYPLKLAGLSLANDEIDRMARRSLAIYMPWVMIIASMIVLFAFRSFWALFIIVASVLSALGTSIGFYAALGFELNLVTGVVPPLLLAIGFAAAIHFISHYATLYTQAKEEHVNCVYQLMSDKAFPTLFALLTTAIGFGSLIFSKIIAIRVLGGFASIGILFLLLYLLWGLPSLLLLIRPPIKARKKRIKKLSSFVLVAIRYRKIVISTAIVIAFFLGSGILSLDASVDGFDMLPKSSKLRQNYKNLEREGIALGNIDLWIPLKLNRQQMLHDATRLERLANNLSGKLGIQASIGVHDLLKDLNYRISKRVELPQNLDALDLVMDQASKKRFDKLLSRFWQPKSGLKLSLLCLSSDVKTVNARKTLIKRELERIFPEVRSKISGHFAMLIDTPRRLMETLALSLTITIGTILFFFMLYFRSLNFVLAAFVSNLFPIIFILGLMGWLDFPIDVATVMVTSIAFGLAVDDSFHFLYQYRKNKAIDVASAKTIEGIVVTSLTLIMSFSVLSLSPFIPIFRFGWMSALVICIALIADIFLLPSIVAQKGSELR